MTICSWMAQSAEMFIFSRVGGGTEIEVKISSRLAYRSSPALLDRLERALNSPESADIIEKISVAASSA
jgi:hypothetical protein